MNLKDKIKKIIKSDFIKNIIKYTIIFCFLAFFMYYTFNKYGKLFIWKNDGPEIHYVNLRYFRELLIGFIKTGNFSTFSWHVANGMDLFSNYTYFIFGDIFSYLSILVKTKHVELLYSFLILLRMYFVGISFLIYTKYKKINNNSSLIGALLYTFSSYILYGGIRHPYFIDSIILFPLLMIGIEKIIKEEKFIFYTIIIAITYLVNYYFAYSLSLVIAIYGVILAINTYKKDGLKKILKVLFKTLFFSLLGIMITGIVLLPTGISFLDSERVSKNLVSNYSISYYRNLVNNILSAKGINYWTLLGTQSLIFITLPLFIYRKRKENYPILILLLFLLLPILISSIGSVFVGFNFPNNRWSFVFSFIFAFITTMFLNSDCNLDKKDLTIIILSLACFFLFDIIFEIKLELYTVIQLFILLIFIVLMLSKNKLSKLKNKFNFYNFSLALIVCIGICFTIKYTYDINGINYISEFKDKSSLTNLINTSKNKIKKFKKAIDYIQANDKDFYFINKNPYNYENLGLMLHFNSSGSNVSITPNSYAEFSRDLENSQYYLNHGFRGFDYRTRLSSLMGVKYLISSNTKNIPYGYEKIKSYDGTKIYKNQYYLPFGILYNSYITEKEYNNLTPLEREVNMLKTTVLSKDSSNFNVKHSEYDYSKIVKEIDYKIIDKNNIFTDSNEFVINNTSKNSFDIEISDIEYNGELYVSFENFDYNPFSKEELINLNIKEDSTLNDIALVKQKYKWYQESEDYTLKVNYNKVSKSVSNQDYLTSAYYMDLSNTMFNLGYYDKLSGKITVSLDAIGNYGFDSIKIYVVSMDGYEEDINNLRKSNFEATEWNNGYIKGKVNAETDGILQFQTIYSNGFKVYVDGKEVETLKSNKYFLGIKIDKGEHNIYIKYETPYLKFGAIVSIISLGVFVTISIVSYKNKKNIRKKISY